MLKGGGGAAAFAALPQFLLSGDLGGSFSYDLQQIKNKGKKIHLLYSCETLEKLPEIRDLS